MSFTTIKRESTLEVIVQQIKDQIKKGILKSGEKLPSERKLAELLGVSRASVREAIQALAFSGYPNMTKSLIFFRDFPIIL